MKGKLHPTNDATINPSCNESILDVIDRVDGARRRFIKTGLGASTLAAMGGVSSLGLVRAVEAAPIPAANGFAGIGFENIPAKVKNPALAPLAFADTVDIPAGYGVGLLAAWGDPVTPAGPAWAENASQDATAQENQYGMHNDGMHYFGFPVRGAPYGSNERGLLCVNHEYTEESILHVDGLTSAQGIPGSVNSIAKARKSQAAHGVSVMEVRKIGNNWTVVANSAFGRRITGNTPVAIGGPAAGHPLMQAKKYVIGPTGSTQDGIGNGREGNGTLNNCANGYTPWGTYLTCEENWNQYFGTTTGSVTTAEATTEVRKGYARYGVPTGSSERDWQRFDARFDLNANPLEVHHFGWVVEIDPFDPASKPVKRTALGRFKHESAQVAVGNDNGVAFYQGDDERNEYIYKFVCAGKFNPGNRAANKQLLDTGILYVAKFTDTAGQTPGSYRGRWIPLVPDQEAEAYPVDPGLGRKPKLREVPDFAAATDAEVLAKILIGTRIAADAVGATMMDRPEWTALRTYAAPNGGPGTLHGGSYGPGRPLEIYCTLTNNNRRGSRPPATASNNAFNGTTAAGQARPLPDVANPRSDNVYGHIIRWREDANSVSAIGFEWDIFVLAGDTISTKTPPAGTATVPDYFGNIVDVPAGSADFGAPDGLWFDYFGRMWIQTDQQGDAGGDFNNIGANTMLCADPNTKEVRRFLTSPPNCEVTGIATTPDGKAVFCGIQHPGEGALASDPDQFSAWPGSQFATNSAGVPVPNGATRRPRSSVMVITRNDGGIVGGL